jgi:hypothetical protein
MCLPAVPNRSSRWALAHPPILQPRKLRQRAAQACAQGPMLAWQSWGESACRGQPPLWEGVRCGPGVAQWLSSAEVCGRWLEPRGAFSPEGSIAHTW